MQMMQQLLAQSGGGGADSLPPGFANIFGGAGGPGGPPGANGQPMEPQEPPTDSTYIWKLVHAISSVLLALYVTLSSATAFTGSKAAREVSALGGGEDFGRRLFFWFATVEVVLQSSRYFIEKGHLRGSGLLGTVAAILPQPWGNYVRIVGRYHTIFFTLVQDAMAVVFVLGAVAWWNGVAVDV
jgi:hypothetical protein